jgi:hypothetical protein
MKFSGGLAVAKNLSDLRIQQIAERLAKRLFTSRSGQRAELVALMIHGKTINDPNEIFGVIAERDAVKEIEEILHEERW